MSHQGVRGEGALVIYLHIHAPGSSHQEAVDRLVPLGLFRAILEDSRCDGGLTLSEAGWLEWE